MSKINKINTNIIVDFYHNQTVSIVNYLLILFTIRLLFKFYKFSLKLLVTFMGIPLCFFFLMGFLHNKDSKLLTFFYILPLWFFWAVLVSYDMRAAIFMVPVISIVSAFGFQITF